MSLREELVLELEAKVKEIIKSDEMKNITGYVKESYIPSSKEVDLIRTTKIIPKIESIKKEIDRLNDAREEVNKEISKINFLSSDKEAINDASVSSIEENYQKIAKIEKEAKIWTELLSDLRTKRTILFSGDYKNPRTKDQQQVLNVLKSSELARRLIIEASIIYNKSEELKELLSKIVVSKEDLVETSNYIITKYAKTDYDLTNMKHIIDNTTFVNMIRILIEKENLQETLKEFNSNIYDEIVDFLNTVNEKKSYDLDVVDYSNKTLLKIFDDIKVLKDTYSKSEVKYSNMDLFIKTLDEKDISEFHSILNEMVKGGLIDAQKMLNEEKIKEKELYIKSALNKSSYLSKILFLVNTVTDFHPQSKDDIEFMKLCLFIETLFIINYSIESLNVLITYMSFKK